MTRLPHPFLLAMFVIVTGTVIEKLKWLLLIVLVIALCLWMFL